MRRACTCLAVIGVLSLLLCLVPTPAPHAQCGTSYIVVHAHNPEGVEINSIELGPGWKVDSWHGCVQIYDGDNPMGPAAYDAVTHGRPIPVSPGTHTIKARFNGMTLQREINVPDGATKVIVFTFEREEVDTQSLITSAHSDSWYGEGRVPFCSSPWEMSCGMITGTFACGCDPANPEPSDCYGAVGGSGTFAFGPTMATASMSATASIVGSDAHIDRVYSRNWYNWYKDISIPPSSKYESWLVQNYIEQFPYVDTSEPWGRSHCWLDYNTEDAFVLVNEVDYAGNLDDYRYYFREASAKKAWTSIMFYVDIVPVPYAPGGELVNMLDCSPQAAATAFTCSSTWSFPVAGGATVKMSTVPYDLTGTGVKEVKPPVLLVHGYKGKPSELDAMACWLRADGFDARCVDYAGGHLANGDIKQYASKLAMEVELVKAETGAKQVDIIAHSMGGLISRWYIEKSSSGASNIRKLIMLGTPNHGSELFGIERWPVLGQIVSWLTSSGIAGEQMTPGGNLTESLGYRGSSNYYTIAGTDHGLDPNPILRWFTNLFLEGDDDGLVRTVSVRLSGVAGQYEYYLNHKELETDETLYDNVIKNILLDKPITEQKYVGLATQQGNNTVQEAPMISEKIFSGEQKSYGIPISATSEVDFALAWGDGDLDLTLTTPSGTTIDPSIAEGNSSISYYQDGNTTIEGYTVMNPEPGIWQVNISAIDVPSEGEDYMVLTFLETTITLSVNLSKYQYDPGEQISIVAELQSDSMPLTGASVTAEIQRPDESVDSLALHDDGLHDDGEANDGVYANAYANTATSGAYDITVSANGTVDSGEFARQAFATVWVEQYPDLTLASSDISFSDDAPIVGDNITIEATIHNIGDAEAGNATISFYDGEPASGVLIGENIIDVNASQTGNASTTWNPTAGQHEIHVVISPFNGFLEKAYTNNEASRLIDVESYAQIEVSLKAGWNMVSVPVTLGNSSVGAVFPGTAAVYTWDPVSKGYIVPTTIEASRGYWVAVIQDGNITVTGVPVTTWTTDIKAGWNMTGSVINNASIANPNDNPDSSVQPFAYWWDPVSKAYIYTTDIEPGKGYWVASVQDCTLTMP